MSPSTLRRYRAERLLRQEFGELRGEVLASVRARLRARGVHLDGGDLEACYAQAWQGLYAAIAAGEEIANPGGWLTVVAFRRAIDECRSCGLRTEGERIATVGERSAGGAAGGVQRAAVEPDVAGRLDDSARLRHLFEALRGRLSARECEAASLCYLQGLTRAQAAERMGISEARMRKLMEGSGQGRPGVARKVGELLEAIRDGEWCEQQSSLMRALRVWHPRPPWRALPPGAPAPAGVPGVSRVHPLAAGSRGCAAATAASVGIRDPIQPRTPPHPAAGHGAGVRSGSALDLGCCGCGRAPVGDGCWEGRWGRSWR